MGLDSGPFRNNPQTCIVFVRSSRWVWIPALSETTLKLVLCLQCLVDGSGFRPFHVPFRLQKLVQEAKESARAPFLGYISSVFLLYCHFPVHVQSACGPVQVRENFGLGASLQVAEC